MVFGGTGGGGKGKTAELPPITVRQDFPENWRIILLINSREKGIHGQKEYNAFKTLKPFPEDLSEKTCRLVNMVILPSLIEKNFNDLPWAGDKGIDLTAVVQEIKDTDPKAIEVLNEFASWADTVTDEAAIKEAENYLLSLKNSPSVDRW